MDDHHEHGGHGDDAPDPRDGGGRTEHAVPAGVTIAANGLRLEPVATRFTPGKTTDWEFRIADDDGTTVSDFDVAHGERSHLIVVRRDLTHFQHLHPILESNGTWRVETFSLPAPGVYRAFVDVVVDGLPTTLGFDLFAAGTMDVEPRPESTRMARLDGYEVALLTDDITLGAPNPLTFEVRLDGEPVPALDEYLDALGHLVAIREGDLAYLHVHPEATSPTSGRVKFIAHFPTAGRYRLFLQTKPGGNILTASFDVTLQR